MFVESLQDYSWYLVPMWKPAFLMGHLLVFSLLIVLWIRHKGQAQAAGRAGGPDRQALHAHKAGIYMRIIKISLALTIIPQLLWMISLYLPGWVAYYTPLPILMGLIIWVPFLVWLAPVVALAVELMIRDTKNLTR
jgi:hypothetical protein